MMLLDFKIGDLHLILITFLKVEPWLEDEDVSMRTTVRKTVHVEDKLLSLSRYKINKILLSFHCEKTLHHATSGWGSKAIEAYQYHLTSRSKVQSTLDSEASIGLQEGI